MLSDGSLKPVENLKVGDLLMGDDSQPRTILSVCQGQDTMVNIHLESGPVWQCNLAHILCLKKRNYLSFDWKIKTNAFQVNWLEGTQQHTDLFAGGSWSPSHRHILMWKHRCLCINHMNWFSGCVRILHA